MSNNRGNNRRRGRGNRSQGNNPVNRIDSRARGNAPQLLEKYKKLAHDSQLNGDRVQAEYYLQFADHYFRVIADGKAQKDEQRARRDEDRDQRPYDDDGDEEDTRQQQPRGRSRSSRDDRDDGDNGDGNDFGREGEEIEPEDNPFTRESKPRTRSRRKPAREDQGADAKSGEGLDASVLPPSISRGGDDGQEAGEEAPKPRRRAPRKRKTDGEDEALETVG